MANEIRSVFIPGPAGRLEALLNAGAPEAPYAALVCHPHPLHGGTMHNKVVFQAMKALNGFGLPVLRFNFRGAGLSEGVHDEGRGEQDDIRAALDWLDRQYSLPIIFAGFSFGAATGLKTCCSDLRVVGLISLGTPVAVLGRLYEYSFLSDCTKPKLMVSGNHDQFGPAANLSEVFDEAAEPKELVLVEGADHFFEGKLPIMREAIVRWLLRHFPAVNARSAPDSMDASENSTAAKMREVARQVFLQTLEQISIPHVFSQKVEYSRGMLRVEHDLYDLGAYARVLVVAMGKAAHTMLESLVAQTGPALEGIVVCSEPPESQQPGFRYFLGGHPLPTEESLRGARAILKYLSGLNDNTLVIYLISGGGSAMVEVPRDEEVSVEDLADTYRALVLSGATIGEINAIRKHLSAVKGGRMAQAAYPARQVSIMVSDVPEHSLDALASGPTMPDSTTTEDCYRIAERHGITSQLTTSVRSLFDDQALEETAKSDDPAFVNSRWWPILSSASAAQAAASLISKHGFGVEIDNTPDDWPYDRAAEYLLRRLRELRQGVSRVALVSAGEVTVRVPANGGIGGRNQHFALHCAEQIAGENITALSAGTDGIDGNSPAAGAVVDGTTIERAKAANLNLKLALERFDSFPLFQKLTDAVITGSTGNNVRDIRIFFGW